MADDIDWATAPLHSLSLGQTQRGADAAPVVGLAMAGNPIDLAPRPLPWRVWFIDDDLNTLGVLAVNAATWYASVFELTVCPTSHTAWINSLREAVAARACRPDLVVIDANLAIGGRTSFEWVREIRRWAGAKGMPIVLATGGRASDLAQGPLLGVNQLNLPQRDWHAEALAAGAEAMLYSKNGSALFLGRLGQALPNWQHAARRRLHAETFATLATKTHHRNIDIDPLMKWVVQRLVDEFDMESSRIRWREGKAYRLAAEAGEGNFAALNATLTDEQMPLFRILINETGPGEGKKTVWRSDGGLRAEDVGAYGGGLLGKLVLGTAIFLGTRIFGFITLVRDDSRPPFDALDEEMLTTLRALLAAIVVRQDLLRVNRQRQTRLLQFSRDISHSERRTVICEQLVTLLHELIHDSDDDKGKVTCRMVNHHQATLDSRAWAGYGQEGAPFSLAKVRNLYTHAVREPLPAGHLLVADMRSDLTVERTDMDSRSELCVPILIGDHAIGAVNLEHHELDHYRQDDAALVMAACAVAAQAMQETSSRRFAESLMGLMESMPDASVEDIETSLLALLWQLTRYAALVKLKPVNLRHPTGPWQVEGEIDCQLEGVDLTALSSTINAQYRDWSTPDAALAPGTGPWFPELVAQRAWLRARAVIKTNLTGRQSLTLVEGIQTCDDAVLWLCRPGKKPGSLVPYRALLLMWGAPAPVGEAQIRMLEQLARQLSAFEGLREQARSLAEAKMLGEGQARIGALMQHFRHNLTSVAQAQKGTVELLITAMRGQNWDSALGYAEMAQANVEQLLAAYDRSRFYVKVVEARRVLVKDIIDSALAEASWRSRQRRCPVQIERAVPPDLYCRADPVIAAMVLGTLLDNAHDELASLTTSAPMIRVEAGSAGDENDPRIYIDVIDNGAGVPQAWEAKLFKAGNTTKTGDDSGQGIALVLAQGRMRDIGMDGDLEYMGNDGPGARFRAWLPRAKQV